jgi:hypothetical protein
MRTKILVVAVGLVVTACSSSGTKGHGAAGSAGSTQATGGGTASSSAATGGGGGGGGEYCAIIRGAKSNIDALTKMQSSGVPAGVKVGVIVDAIHKADAAAPANIKPQWDLFRTKIDQLIAALQSAGISLDDLSDPAKMQKLDPAQLQKLESIGQQFDTPEFTKASEAITANVKTECGVDIGGS